MLAAGVVVFKLVELAVRAVREEAVPAALVLQTAWRVLLI
jgi:hypothetical protein